MTILVSVSHHLKGGHQAEWLRLFARWITVAGGTVQFSKSGLDLLFSPDPMFYMFFEERFELYALVMLVRSIVGLRTGALLFRPRQCVRPQSLRWWLKRQILRLLRQFPRCAVMTLVPFSIAPEFSKIARYGVFDPQIWDLDEFGGGHVSGEDAVAIADLVANAASGRRVVSLLGSLSDIKGFNEFARLWCEGGDDLRARYAFVAAGIVREECVDAARTFTQAGGLLVDRQITNDEMFALYKCSDLVWCSYAPIYDQSSGIFGRAFQFGRPVILRSGSMLEQMAKHLHHPAIVTEWGDVQGTTKKILTVSPAPRSFSEAAAIAKKVRQESMASIKQVLCIR